MNSTKMASIACLITLAVYSGNLLAHTIRKGSYTMLVNVHYQGKQLGNPLEINVERSETIGAIKEKLANQAQALYSQVGQNIDSNPGKIMLFIGNKEITDHNVALRHLLRTSGPLVETNGMLKGTNGQEIFIQLNQPAAPQEKKLLHQLHRGRIYQPLRNQ